MKRLHIALLDDHAIVRHGLVNRLVQEPDFEVVGVYSRSRDLITGLATAPAEILLLDFVLGPCELDGISLIRALRVKFPACRILIFSTHHDAATAILALRVGARGFLGKGEDMEQLICAVRLVASGAVYLSPDMAYRVAEATAVSYDGEANGRDEALRFVSLSAREQEVIRCYLAGMTITEIAEKFNRSIKTISSQKAAAFRKLGVMSNNELFRIRHIIEGI
ncbi:MULTISPECIES: response regulator transcription factor [Pseudomonas]|jgi:two-component system capsular synthesis response regulator RcsB|uniref:response regulator transcription factor n=1 Tax=Pseudomonas TaxID=286 RepID=UPI00099DCE27|nr:MULTISPECIES: response regulator transcription factor [Pseudomonas]MCK3839194.1 response regulator transcription factor [Pseudomonas sp. NCIMB 10586]MCK3846987.1 response regulator transcription factor [Pseudomonas sp. W15Feb34]MCK3861570.1 response regulator transcription factor [Pseudomonas sp. B329]OPB05248.1 DNA-binding response regulator [Pseudomonas synxantha]QOY73675.1 response regulator transcription factor [Pseudomonas sp. OST1909]